MRRSVGSLVLLLLVTHCGQTGSLSSSESHFLGSCAGDTDCAEGLECVCGLCTDPCEENDDCSGVDGPAECLVHSEGTCDVEQVCDVACTENTECEVLGDAYACDAGRCRETEALMGGADGGSGGTSGSLTGGDGATESGSTSSAGALGLAGCAPILPLTYRDFRALDEDGGHPDFEISARGVTDNNGELFSGWNDIGCGLVEPTLGSDKKPVFYSGPADVVDEGIEVPVGAGRQQRVVSGPGCWSPDNPNPSGACSVDSCIPWEFAPPTNEIASAASFDEWYNTIDGVNVEVPGALLFTDPGTGQLEYENEEFFPIDDEGFGNSPGFDHNYHFTTEIHVSFVYESGQYLVFNGDDDVWVFVNGRLALDLGGVHDALETNLDLDALSEELELTPGNRYSLDIFHAERQTAESVFQINTSIRCFFPEP